MLISALVDVGVDNGQIKRQLGNDIAIGVDGVTIVVDRFGFVRIDGLLIVDLLAAPAAEAKRRATEEEEEEEDEGEKGCTANADADDGSSGQGGGGLVGDLSIGWEGSLGCCCGVGSLR